MKFIYKYLDKRFNEWAVKTNEAIRIDAQRNSEMYHMENKKFQEAHLKHGKQIEQGLSTLVKLVQELIKNKK